MHRSLRLFSRVVLLSTVGLLASACPGGKLENAEEFAGDCDALPIFAQSCQSSLCHEAENGDAPSGVLDLVAPGVAQRIYGMPAVSYGEANDAENCPVDSPELLLDPNDVEKSLLLTKLLGTHSCGKAMPVPNPPKALSDSEIACVRSWLRALIEAGPPDGMAGASSSGGASATGGAASGGAASGGASTGGASTGGTGTGGAL